MEKTYAAIGGCNIDLDRNEIQNIFTEALSKALSDINNSGRIIILPPDITRIHSRAGFLTEIAVKYLGNRLGAILPALGTHTPMKSCELSRMFAGVPKEKFLVHDWRNDITELGQLKADFVEKITEGAVHYGWPVQVNKLLCRDNCGGNFSLVLSIGQVVPHEVAGMANHAKNIFVGTGGKEAIDKSHFAGAVYGMERIMGRTDTPVRSLFDEGIRRFESKMPPVLWVLTVIGERTEAEITTADQHAVRGLFIGFGRECFEKAASLSQEINVSLLEEPVSKVVVYLNPEEYRTTWLGNKAIYRTRMAIKDGGELLILAPALERFGEDLKIDTLIRKYGYRPQEEIAKAGPETGLGENLSAAAHLIHGCSGGRFTVRYCPGDKLSRKDIESVGFQWGDLDEALSRYDINRLSQGWNTIPDGERFFYIPNPALGLWAEKQCFNKVP